MECMFVEYSAYDQVFRILGGGDGNLIVMIVQLSPLLKFQRRICSQQIRHLLNQVDCGSLHLCAISLTSAVIARYFPTWILIRRLCELVDSIALSLELVTVSPLSGVSESTIISEIRSIIVLIVIGAGRCTTINKASDHRNWSCALKAICVKLRIPFPVNQLSLKTKRKAFQARPVKDLDILLPTHIQETV
ncbi:hypothetical protein GJ496_002663 [Pomphorhynchus laevis]|nr:hypothetical protein GJ496_002663 [Pomphorhynchus laevis]